MVFFNILLIDKMWVWEVKGRNDPLKNHLIFFNIVGIVIINAIWGKWNTLPIGNDNGTTENLTVAKKWDVKL